LQNNETEAALGAIESLGKAIDDVLHWGEVNDLDIAFGLNEA
jgi:hypothetical protein